FDLSSYRLTDNLSKPGKWTIPAGTFIPAGGFLLVWADNDTNQNHLGGELHAGFDLAASGEAIGLYTPDLVELDHVTFGPQVTDQSQGRYPDGGSSITNMVAPSPRLPNLPPYNNTPPAL